MHVHKHMPVIISPFQQYYTSDTKFKIQRKEMKIRTRYYFFKLRKMFESTLLYALQSRLVDLSIWKNVRKVLHLKSQSILRDS